MVKSKLITFIGGFYMFGGVIVLLSLIFHGSTLNHVFGLPQVPDYLVKFIVAALYIPMGYFYMKRIKFAYWAILVLAILSFCISADLTTRFDIQPYIGNMIYSLFVIIVSLLKRKEFFKPGQCSKK